MAATGGGPGPRRIIYIDDDRDFALLVKRACERRGHSIVTCAEPQYALKALAQDPLACELVITDYRMPGTDGLEVARTIRTLYPALPVVIMSGLVDDALVKAAAGVGVRRVLHKPFRAEHLIVLIELAAKEPAHPPEADTP